MSACATWDLGKEPLENIRGNSIQGTCRAGNACPPFPKQEEPRALGRVVRRVLLQQWATISSGLSTVLDLCLILKAKPERIKLFPSNLSASWNKAQEYLQEDEPSVDSAALVKLVARAQSKKPDEKVDPENRKIYIFQLWANCLIFLSFAFLIG